MLACQHRLGFKAPQAKHLCDFCYICAPSELCYDEGLYHWEDYVAKERTNPSLYSKVKKNEVISCFIPVGAFHSSKCKFYKILKIVYLLR